MTAEIPSRSPEKETTPDDARKFVMHGVLSDTFLDDPQTTTHDMVIDWTAVGDGTETKIAHKTDNDGNVAIVLITKTKKGDSREVEPKKAVAPEAYDSLVADPLYHLEKRRYEFPYEQNGVQFTIKYDVIEGGKLYLLEVDASTPAKRELFDMHDPTFPRLTEVSGKPEYEGYKIVDFLKTLSAAN